jgi:hypothetical protein
MLSFCFLPGVSQGGDNWRTDKIASYQKTYGNRDKHGNLVGRSFDLGGVSKLNGKATLLVLSTGPDRRYVVKSPLAAALKKRIQVEVIEKIPENLDDFTEAVSDTTQLWIWAGQDAHCLPPAYVDTVCRRIEKGMSAFLLADNTPFTQGVESILMSLDPNSRIEGDYPGGQTIQANDLGPGFDSKHPIFKGITSLYEGITVSSVTGSRLRTLARSSDGNPLICVAQLPSGYGRVLITGGFTAFFERNWDTAGIERLALNAAAFLAGISK